MSQVTVIDLITPKGVVLANTEIPQEDTVHDIVNELVDQLSLPRFADGKPVSYSLHWVNQRVTLKDQDTLPDAGVGTGDQLKLVSSTPNIAVEEEGGIQTGVGDADKTVDVVLSVLDLNKGTVETLQLDTKVGDLIKEITSKNELPKVDKLNVPIIYRMSSKAKGQILLESDTLRKARVPRHDRLSIVREDIPGGEPS